MKLILGIVIGIVVATVGIRESLNLLDQGIEETKDFVKENIGSK